jgi:hypothetical protein
MARKQTRDPETIPLFKGIDPNRKDSIYRTIEYMALRGFHAHKIADVAGVTLSQVYRACGHMQVKLKDYRNGIGEVAGGIVKMAATMVNIKQ